MRFGFVLLLGTCLYAQANLGNLSNVASAASQTASSPWLCKPASASGTTYTCTPTLLDGTAIASSLLAAPVQGQQMVFIPDVTNTGSSTIQIDGSNNRQVRTGNNFVVIANDLTGGRVYIVTFGPSNRWYLSWGTVAGGTGITMTGNFSQTASLSPIVPVIAANGRATAQTAANASVTSGTVGASDSTYTVSANVNVTASATFSFSVTVSYTDETNTARVLSLTFSQITGTLLTVITNVQGTGAYEGVPLQIRCKALSSITVATSGTFTSVTYNVEAFLTLLSAT